MRSMFVKRGFASALASLTLFSGVCASAQTKQPSLQPSSKIHLQSAYAKLPLAFEANRGQTDSSVQFLAHTPQASVFLSGSDAVLKTSSSHKDAHGRMVIDAVGAVRMHLDGAAQTPVAATEQPLSGTVNYLHGSDNAHWQTNLPTFGGVRLSSVYPGVDLRYYGHAGQLEYDFIVAPHADATAVKLQFQGTEAKLDKNGDLVLPTGTGQDLRFDKPVAYQTINGKRVNVDATFTVAANKVVMFQLGSYDHTRELVIDPTLVFLGTLGTGTAPANNNLSQITVDSAGELFFIGTTNDPSLPVTSNAYQKVCGPTKGNNGQVTYYGGYCPSSGGGENAAYIAKLSADGTQLVYATYLSGQSGTEQGTSIAVDASGIAYLLGTTGSDDFPVTSDAYQKNCVAYYGVFGGPNVVKCDGYYNGGGTEYTIGNQDAFFAKLSPDGSTLLYSSFLSGTLPVYPNTIGLDASGNIYLSGQVAVLNAASLAPCANGYNQGCQPNVQFPGITSTGYQTISSALNQYGNSTNINAAAFLSKFSNDGHTLLYGTFFGDNTNAVDVDPTTMAVGVNGVVFLGGYTFATAFPTTNGAVKPSCTQVQTQYNGASCNTADGYVAAIDTTKSGAASLVYSTRLGGTAMTQGSNIPDQEVLGLTADASNNAFATGYTYESTFNVGAGGYQSACPNNTGNIAPTASGYYDRCNSAFVVKLNPTGTQILNGSFLGGPDLRSAGSVGYNVRLDSKGQVYLYGLSNDGGGDFPQVNALQPYKGGNQLFVSAFTADLSKLLFSTRFGNPSYTDHSVSVAGGMALDGSNNIYFAGNTTDVTFGTTTGTYSTPGASGNVRAFFVKLSKVLQPTTTALTVMPNPAVQGGSVTYKAVVSGMYQNTPAPTGTVTFQFSNTTPATVIGTGTLDSTGTATFTGQAPAAGTYTVVAAYGADTTYDTSTSSSSTLTSSSKASTTTSVLSSAPTATTGASVTFTATVASSIAGTPTGTVTFYDGSISGSVLGTATLSNSMAAVAISTLSVGTHAVLAVYSGDNSYVTSSGNTTEVITAVVPPATISLTANPSTLTITHGSSGTAVITATPSGSFSGTLSLACGTLPTYATCSFAPVSLTFSNSMAAQTTTLTIRTNNATAMLRSLRDGSRTFQILAATLFLPMGFVGLAMRRTSGKLQWAGLLMLLAALTCATVGITGCGGGGNSSATTGTGSTTTAPGTYTVPITATAGGTMSSLNLSIVVQ